jgi:hypothetical protein
MYSGPEIKKKKKKKKKKKTYSGLECRIPVFVWKDEDRIRHLLS